MTRDMMGSEPAAISLPLQEARGTGSRKHVYGLVPGELMKIQQISKTTTRGV
jgi:hypothetical protein